MRMIIAINNKQIEEQIINYYYSKYEVFVAETSDMVLKLSQDNTDVIAIIREDIKGNIDFKNLIIRLQKISVTLLKYMSVFDINCINFIDSIANKRKIIYHPINTVINNLMTNEKSVEYIRKLIEEL